MKTLFYAVLALMPLTLGAVNRSVIITDPGTVYAGQAFYLTTSASTDATDAEQIGFYHGLYSYDNGASWIWFTSDVDAGKSATRNAWINTGAAYSQIIIMVKIAFRGGGAGDVDYNGNAIDWGGSWSNNAEPPAKKLTITVQPPPNQPPTITWVQPNSTSASYAYVNQWTPVQARANDPDGNLASTLVWREWIPHAFNGGGNGWECYSDPNGYTRQTPGGTQFQAQAQDSDTATSSIIYHTITYNNRAPTVGHQFVDSSDVALPTDGLGRAIVEVNQQFYVKVTGNDPDGALSLLGLYMQNPSGGTHASTTQGVSGGSASHNFGPQTITTLGIYPTTSQVWDQSGTGSVQSYGPHVIVGNNAPQVSHEILNSSQVVVPPSGGQSQILQGQSFYVRVTASDPDGLTRLYVRMYDPDNQLVNAQDVAASGTSASHIFGPFTASKLGVYDVWAHAKDASATSGSPPAGGIGLGWNTSQSPDMFVPDTSPPSIPNGLVKTSLTHNSFTLSWSASTDNVGVTGYEVLRDTTSLGTTSGLSLSVTGLSPNTTYAMKVRAYDAAGNTSGWSSPLNVTTDLDPNADDDGDGFTNGQEEAMGTDPGSAPTSGNLNLKVFRP